MTNMTRFDAFNDVNDLLKGLFVRPMVLGTDLPVHSIKLDVARAGDSYSVKAEMPGVSKDDIHVSVDGSLVTIAGEVKRESEEKKGKDIVHSECYYGKVSRSFTLPQEIDAGKVDAKYADGVLNLTLPLKSKSSGQRVTVK
jgi:HSP20 family protein